MICHNCISTFKTYIEIDGKLRSLHKRKFCLKCSPFGKHNTKPDLNFNKKQRKKLHNGTYCREYYRKLREKAITILGAHCVSCNISNTRLLQFDHITGSSRKEKSKHRMLRQIINKERHDIQLLCGNCHMVKTMMLLKQNKTNNPSIASLQRRRYFSKLRLKSINKLGGKCSKCNETNIDKLHIDHIISKSTKQLYYYSASWSRNKFFLDIIHNKLNNNDAQVLCVNCHIIKTIENNEYMSTVGFEPTKKAM